MTGRTMSRLFRRFNSTVSLRLSSLNKYQQSFPNDKITATYIECYKRVNLFPPGQPGSSINIGVTYSQQVRLSKFIDVLLSDPLSEGNKTWFNTIENRLKLINNSFGYILKNEVQSIQANEVNEGKYHIPSPILSADFRSLQKLNLSKVNANNILITEVNNGDLLSIDLLIRISSEFRSEPTESERIVLFDIIDNQDYTPRSGESSTFDVSSTIKVDSEVAFKGIKKFLEFDLEASSEYVESIQKSNFNEVAKALTWYLDIENLNKLIIGKITTRLDNKGSLEYLQTERRAIEIADIADFNATAHTELQQEFIPNTNRYFRRNLHWWQLYYKNDNVEYDIKDFLGQNFLHSSTAKYSYLKGQIDSKLSSEIKGYTISPNENPISEFKNEVINNRVVRDLQPVVNKVLIDAFLFFQLPVTVISALAYQFFDFEASSVVALALLGWTIGFNHVSKYWTRTVDEWLKVLFEDARICLTKKSIDEGLVAELNEKYEAELENAKIRSEVVRELDNKV